MPLPTWRPDPPPKTVASAEPVSKERKRPSAQDLREPNRSEPPRLQNDEDIRTAALESLPGLMVDSASVERWQAKLMAHLERRKRYPTAARGRREEGTAQIRFHINHVGDVLAAGLVQSSGFAALDEEAVRLVRRASPVPKPPPEIPGLITMPVRFTVK